MPNQVYLIDDDEAVRDSLVWALEGEGLKVAPYSSAGAFLEAAKRETFGCVVSDIRMERLSGVDLQRRLRELGIDMPVILITGHASLVVAIAALREGAFDFVEKPVDVKYLAQRIHEGLSREDLRRTAWQRRAEAAERIASLSPRERDVFHAVAKGRLNKQIAGDLGISAKTVEIHRARVMEKLYVRSVAELIRLHLAHESRAE
ncbi:response regulator transcription factor [Bosea thiooxidans]|nr:response regulator [Bosea sp. (in: a-proteobacteria)]